MVTRRYLLAVHGAALVGTLAPARLALAQPAPSHRFINILTAGTGGIFYPLGGALSTLIAARIAGTRPSVQSTRGSVENLNLMQQGRGEVAFVQGDALAFAWAGNPDAGFTSKLDKVRGIAALYPSFIQVIATEESGIKTFTQLKGKRLSVGAERSGTELTTRTLVKAAGMTYKARGQIVYRPCEETVDLMKNRELDATLQTAGLGVPVIRELANSFSIVVVEIPPAIVDKVGRPYQRAVIPKGSYRGQDNDVQAAGLPNYLVTRADMPDELVYNITKALFESTAELTAAHPAAAGISLQNALAGMPVPVHPGAQLYYKEKGVTAGG
jgi:TRAP transporter TAXI family solute receptor